MPEDAVRQCAAQHRSHPKVSLVEAVNEARSSTEHLLAESAQIVDLFKDSLGQSNLMDRERSRPRSRT